MVPFFRSVLNFIQEMFFWFSALFFPLSIVQDISDNNMLRFNNMLRLFHSVLAVCDLFLFWESSFMMDVDEVPTERAISNFYVGAKQMYLFIA